MKSPKRHHIHLIVFAFALISIVTYISQQKSSIEIQFRYQYNKALSQSPGSLNLSNITPAPWDELIVWKPYSNICDYGIQGYSPDSPNCDSLDDDSECALIFLDQNRLVAILPINRKQLDFAGLAEDKRIPRQQAQFTYNPNQAWPVPTIKDPIQ